MLPWWMRLGHLHADEREKARRDFGQFWRPGEPRIWTPYGFARRLYHDKRGVLFIPQTGIVQMEHNFGAVGTAQPGTSVTTGGASSTKGTPAQLIASTAFDSYWIRITASNYANSNTQSRGCLDVLVGAATEDVWIPDLLFGACGGFGTGTTNAAGAKTWDFPLFLPSGSRVAVQAAGQRTSTAFTVGVQLYGGRQPFYWCGSAVTTYGIGTVPAGTSVTPTQTTEGAWTQISASSSADHFAFVPSFQPGADSSLTPVKRFWMDIGIGAATEEVLAGPEQSYIFLYDTGECCEGPHMTMPTFACVPSGTRLTTRLSTNGAVDTANPECALHGVS